DQRAESVANVLSDFYGIAPENLATHGYGESYLKVNTVGPEQENRRVTIRRVTALVRPVAAGIDDVVAERQAQPHRRQVG
ncbi:hypothetical protein ACC870_38345, partial [Rhizobium ruizarguesonis]